MRRVALSLVASTFVFIADATGHTGHANDSAAELSVGGLVFTRSADVSMESEELTISPEVVSVRYRFINHAAQPVTLTIAFPLPDIDLSEGESLVIPSLDPVNFMGFQTKVDGKAVEFNIYQTAFLGSENVSAALRSLGVPLLPIGANQSRLMELPDGTRRELIKRGLLLPNGLNDHGQQLYEAAWIVKTAAIRQQTFEPNRPTIVEHRYHTSLGISFDTVLRKGLRQKKAMAAEVARYRREYCISDGFLANLDRLAGETEGNTAKLQERRIAYVLKTGANWAGPVKEFKLKIDRQKPDRLISFCLSPTIESSPTVTEFTAQNYTPQKDLKILIVGKFQ
jgi:hypothetical protein